MEGSGVLKIALYAVVRQRGRGRGGGCWGGWGLRNWLIKHTCVCVCVFLILRRMGKPKG